MDKLNFIVVHHSNCDRDTDVLINNILSIRHFYKDNRIIIIKTSTSNIPSHILDENISIYNKPDDSTFIIGVIPLLLKILDDNDKYIILHDSMYLINKLPDNILEYEIYKLWEFNGNFDFSINDYNELLSVINIEYPDILKDLYNNYDIKWTGCFGPSFGGNINFLKKIDSILNVDKNTDYFKGRYKLLLSERIISLIITYIKTIENDHTKIISLNGSIFCHPNGFRSENNISLPFIKNKVIENKYNTYFYKLWLVRN